MCDCKKEKVVKDEYGRLYYIIDDVDNKKEYLKGSFRTPGTSSTSTIDWGKWKIEEDSRVPPDPYFSNNVGQLVIKKGEQLIHELNQTLHKTKKISEQNKIFALIGEIAHAFENFTANTLD